MPKRGKKYIEAAKLIDTTKSYSIEEAAELLKKTATAKFDETIELHARLGVDSRHADQQVRGTVALPHGTGKAVRVAVFAKGGKADEALAAGADFAGEDLIEKVQKGHCYPGHDGSGRTHRSCPRSPWLNAEPEGRYGHDGRGTGC